MVVCCEREKKIHKKGRRWLYAKLVCKNHGHVSERNIHADDGIVVTKMPITGHPGQYTVVLSLLEIAKACHLRIDDIAFTLSELGFLHHHRAATFPIQKRTGNGRVHGEGHHPPGTTADGEGEGPSGEDMIEDEDLGEWKDVEVVVSGEMIEEAWEKWRVKERGVLDENCVLL